MKSHWRDLRIIASTRNVLEYFTLIFDLWPRPSAAVAHERDVNTPSGPMRQGVKNSCEAVLDIVSHVKCNNRFEMQQIYKKDNFFFLIRIDE